MILNLLEKIKLHKTNILLIVIVFLLVLLAFGTGMIIHFYLSKPPLIIETPTGK